MKKILVVGGGGHGRAVAEMLLLLDQEFDLQGFIDDQCPVGMLILGKPVLGSSEQLYQLRNRADWVVVAIGNNQVRQRLCQHALAGGFQLATVRHPAAWVSPSAELGRGAVVMAGAIVGTEAILGEGAIVNSGAIIDHHGRLDEFAHLGVGVNLAGGVHIGSGAWLQAGCSAGYGVKVPAWSVYEPGHALKGN